MGKVLGGFWGLNPSPQSKLRDDGDNIEVVITAHHEGKLHVNARDGRNKP